MKKKFAIAAATAALITASLSFSAFAAATDVDKASSGDATDIKAKVDVHTDPSGDFFEVKDPEADSFSEDGGFVKYDNALYYVQPMESSEIEGDEGHYAKATYTKVTTGVYGEEYIVDGKRKSVKDNTIVSYNGNEYIVKGVALEDNGEPSSDPSVVLGASNDVPAVETNVTIGKVTQDYLLGKDGAVIRGWKYVDTDADDKADTWYYAKADGEAVVNAWVNSSPGMWYFIGDDGAMVESDNTVAVTDVTRTNVTVGENNVTYDLIDGKYFIDENGAWVYGWRYVNVADIDTDDNGVVDERDGYVSANMQWVYFTSNSVKDGWVKDGDNWFYLEDNKAVSDGFVKDSAGNLYYIDKNCYMVKGLHKFANEAMIYANENGVLQSGMQEINGVKYIFNARYYYDRVNNPTAFAPCAKSGTYTIDNVTYVTDSTGRICEGMWTKDVADEWHYADANGKVVKSAAVAYGDSVCYLDADGTMVVDGVYYKSVASDGKITLMPMNNFVVDDITKLGLLSKSVVINNCGVQVNNGWAILNVDTVDGEVTWGYAKDGMAYDGWLLYNGSWYYINMGVMLKDCTTPDGYKVDANGVWVK